MAAAVQSKGKHFKIKWTGKNKIKKQASVCSSSKFLPNATYELMDTLGDFDIQYLKNIWKKKKIEVEWNGIL